MLFSFQKGSKLNFDLCRSAEITLALSMSVLHCYISNWYMIAEVFRISYYSMGTKENCLLKKCLATLIVSGVMFCKQFVAYDVHIDISAFLCNP